MARKSPHHWSGTPDAHSTHADDVLDGLVVALHLHCREDQRALLVHVARAAVIGGGDGVAAIGLMRLGQHREAVAPVNRRSRAPGSCGPPGANSRDRASLCRKASPPPKRRVKLLHRGGHQVGATQERRIGRLSAVASRPQSAVTMQHEKSRAVLRTPERPRAEERVGQSSGRCPRSACSGSRGARRPSASSFSSTPVRPLPYDPCRPGSNHRQARVRAALRAP